ncbi:MAG: NADH-quinone oxidoreductase subunit N [Balneolaceae bacterium]|nr:MAG: NADH-quinone oxidoreductase subunit N [Balneolaceae bacterium]
MVEHTLHSIGQFLPEIVIVSTLCVIIVADLFIKSERHTTGWIMLGGLLLAGYFTIMQIGRSEAVFYDMVAVDPFAVFFKSILILAGIFIVFFSMKSLELESYKPRIGEYYMLIAGMMLGMMMMVGSANLLLMFLALELTSICSYVLVGFTKSSLRSSESSMKYIIYGAVSSGIMLYGISLLIGVTSSTDIYTINEALIAGVEQTLILNISVLMIIVGLGFKIAIVPFHFWAPDVYEGAPVTIAALLAVASKIAAFGMIIRFFSVTFIDSAGVSASGVWTAIEGIHWDLLLGGMAALAMIVGNLTALRQDNIKRMLAYSSIAHAGYILMGLVILTSEGLTAIMIYLFIYLFMNLGAFYVAMLFLNKAGTESIEEYKGLGFRAPLAAIALTIFLVSLTGIPPTGGLIAKLYIFGAAISAGWIWLVVIAGITTVISLFYYIRVVRNMFFYKPDENAPEISFDLTSKLILFALLIPTLFLGIYFAPLLEIAKSSISIIGF